MQGQRQDLHQPFDSRDTIWCIQRVLIVPSSVKSIAEDAFSKCSLLELQSLPGEITGRTNKCIVLSLYGDTQKIDIPREDCIINDKQFGDYKKVNSAPVTRIGCKAFSDCSSLKSVTIPSSTVQIGCNAFDKYTSLQSVVVPNSVEKISNNTFPYGCYVSRK